ncbi:MAG TPA: aminotransferase class I/II-fold pyridoxal phosphate-dependent enzyme [Candidatus Acidoferrales bacterium]|nr:aminotransferase class I/II-fold pyridoxal phosphate-dependent enzyme [Candidatus Acidoferrales bacterium]
MATETQKKLNVPITKPALGEEEARAPFESIRSGWVTQGPKVAEFEKAVASYVGAKHGVATTSCTTGLHLALAAAGIGAGDEVIVPSFTFIASANAVLYTGADVVFCEIDPRTFNVDPNDVEKRITKRTKAIMPIDQIGLACDIDAINAIAKKHGLDVVEDAAPRRDAAPEQVRHEVLAVKPALLRKTQAVRVIGVLRVRRDVGHLDALHFRQLLVVPRGLLAADAEQLVELAELHEADRRLDVGHAVVESELVVLLDDHAVGLVPLEVRHAHAVRAQLARAVGDRVVLGRDHDALAGRDDLARVEREHGLVRVRPDPPPLVRLADRGRGVLDHVEAVLLRDRVDGVDVACEADLVDGHDRLGALGDALLDVVRVDVEGARVDLAEDDLGAGVQHRVRRRDEGERRHDDLVTRADARGREREVQAGRARRRRDAVLRADVRRDGLLELGHLRALRHPAAPDRLEGRARLLLAERGLGDRHVELLVCLGGHGLPPSSCGERLPPPRDQLSHAVCQRGLRPESDDRLGTGRVADAARGQRAGRLRLEFESDTASGDLEQQRREVAHARLDPAADVHDSVGRLRLAREQVRARDVADVHEVDG